MTMTIPNLWKKESERERVYGGLLCVFLSFKTLVGFTKSYKAMLTLGSDWQVVSVEVQQCGTSTPTEQPG